MSTNTVFKGFIVNSKSIKQLDVFNGYLTVENGKITKIGSIEEFKSLEKDGFFKSFTIKEIKSTQFLMPGLIDCHTHGPQFPNIGLGLDLPLLDWLNKYTFPLESKYHDEQFASAVYDKVVKRLLKNGTTTATYFGSLHLNGTLQLVNSVVQNGQRAFVGKVSMNIPNAAKYYNSTQNEADEVEMFLAAFKKIYKPLVYPIITPRFALSCDMELMTQLASSAKKHDCMIQSHVSENLKEIEMVLKMFPGCKTYTDVYDKCKILNNKCILAHAIYLSDDEMSKFAARGTSIAHCPSSNTRLMSGLCPVRRILKHGVAVGLGTDVSGGDNASILDAMRRCLDVSAHLAMTGNGVDPLTWKEAFYLGTLGGATALHLDDKIGNFEIGKEFDALIIDVYKSEGPIDCFDTKENESENVIIEALLQKFFFVGDERNILEVYVNGRLVNNWN